MTTFQLLLAKYLSANPDVLPPADGDVVWYERDGLEWKVSVRNSGGIFEAAIACEDLLGWLWLQQSSQTNS